MYAAFWRVDKFGWPVATAFIKSFGIAALEAMTRATSVLADAVAAVKEFKLKPLRKPALTASPCQGLNIHDLPLKVATGPGPFAHVFDVIKLDSDTDVEAGCLAAFESKAYYTLPAPLSPRAECDIPVVMDVFLLSQTTGGAYDIMVKHFHCVGDRIPKHCAANLCRGEMMMLNTAAGHPQTLLKALENMLVT